MRLLGHMVTRNEAERHLFPSLLSLISLCDDVAVFDDQSTDHTVDMARTVGATVAVRADDEPSFEQHEGQFRNTAWRYMEATLQPRPGDWVICLDADELAIGVPYDLRAELAGRVVDVLSVRIHELWSLDPPQERVDGYWGTITGGRIYRWRPGQTIPDKPMASGSVPAGATSAKCSALRIAHLGYVRPEDRQAKHDRYADRPGHSSAHVSSILKRPTLAPMPGDLPA